MPVPYIISTKRLGLREMRPGDGRFILDLNSHPDVMKFTGDPPFANIKAAETFISSYDSYKKTGMGRWVIELLKSEHPIGWCGIKHHPDDGNYDLGYRILSAYWNKGFATEAGHGCLEWASKSGIKRILTCVHSENKKSLRVSEKLGFEYAYERFYGSLPWMVFEKSI